MFNYRQSNVIERNSFADEFETEMVATPNVETVVETEEKAFNSRIKDNFDRIMSGLYYVLQKNAAQNGHVCLPRQKLCESASELLGVDVEVCDKGISELLRIERFKYLLDNDGLQLIYTKRDYDDEKYIANKLVLLDKTCAAVDLRDIDRFIEGEERRSGIKYASLQKEAIRDALRYGVMILTGGPGTGKPR